MRSVSGFTVGLMFFVLASISMLFAQSGTTSLRGTVTDPSSATVIGREQSRSATRARFLTQRDTGDTGHY